MFSFNSTSGGAETMLVDIVKYQVKQAEVNIILINKTYNETLLNKIDKRVNVFFINRTEGSKSPFPIIKLNRLLMTLKSDVLHCHNHKIIALLFLSSFKQKAVLTVHDINIPTKYFNKYKRLFAISHCVKNDILNRSGIKAILVYNGIYTEKLLHKEKTVKNAFFKLIIVSRLEHEKKGQHLAIEAIKLLRKNGIINIQLDILGAGTSEQYLKEMTKKLGLTDQVNFLGLKDRNYIYTNLKDYDLLIQPSLFEGFGLTVAEGMAAKVPVLVSGIDGPMEIINNGKYGYYFENNNIFSMAMAIKEIIENYNSYDSHNKTEKAYLHVCKYFTLRKTAQNYLMQYKILI
jgi:glycosyltransferase involved in cell wall biosynthesis